MRNNDSVVERRMALFDEFAEILHETHELYRQITGEIRASDVSFEHFREHVTDLQRRLLEMKEMALDLEEERRTIHETLQDGQDGAAR